MSFCCRHRCFVTTRSRSGPPDRIAFVVNDWHQVGGYLLLGDDEGCMYIFDGCKAFGISQFGIRRKPVWSLCWAVDYSADSKREYDASHGAIDY